MIEMDTKLRSFQVENMAKYTKFIEILHCMYVCTYVYYFKLKEKESRQRKRKAYSFTYF